MNRKELWIVKLEKEIMRLLTELNESGTTIIMVTHDHDMTKYASRVISLKDGSFVKGVLSMFTLIKKNSLANLKGHKLRLIIAFI